MIDTIGTCVLHANECVDVYANDSSYRDQSSLFP